MDPSSTRRCQLLQGLQNCLGGALILSINFQFGVPALAGSGRLKAGLHNNRRTPTGSCPPCMRKSKRRFSMGFPTQWRTQSIDRETIDSLSNEYIVFTYRCFDGQSTFCSQLGRKARSGTDRWCAGSLPVECENAPPPLQSGAMQILCSFTTLH